MKSVSLRLIASGGVVAVLAASCSGGSSDDGGDGDNGSGDSANPVAEEMRSWDGCEVLDDLRPIMDYMQIEAIQGSETFNSTSYGQGMDQQAATCSGLVTVLTWEMIDGDPRPNSGELWVGVVPWDTEEEAQANYEERSVDDIESQKGQNSTLEETDRIDLGSEWDEGVLVAMEDEQEHNLNLFGRDGTWLLTVNIRYNKNTGEEFFNENREYLEGKTLEDYVYPFGDEELQQWLVEEYAPAVHQDVIDMIGQE